MSGPVISSPAMSEMDALVLAGGQGTRLRSVLSDRPKPLAEVAGRPFLDHLLSYIASAGVRRAVICSGYMAGHIEEHYSTPPFGLDMAFSREDEPLGTGGSIRNALPCIRSERFFVLNGDSYCPVNLGALLEFHVSKSALATLAVVRASEADQYGSVMLDSEGRVSGFEEKKTGSSEALVNSGVYVFERAVLDLIPSGMAYSLERELFPLLCGKGLFGMLSDAVLLDIGTPERLARAREYFQKKA